MSKKVESKFILHIPAGKANPAPPIGTAFGQRGLNIMEFCKAFNAATQHLDVGAKIPTIVSVYKDKTFSFEIKGYPATYMLMKAAKITKGTKEAGKVAPVGKITKAQLDEIAEAKMKDLNANDIVAAAKIIAGSAMSMGIEIVD